jgi:glycerol-3-phosphate acyltransferase PlsY
LLIAVLVPLAYMLGTFPSAVMVARANGIDITAVGSGNPGASNVTRVLGRWWGVLVFVLDGLKGAIPAAVGALADHRAGSYWLLGAAILGHMFPITRRFRGGKGVATLSGGMMVLQPLASLILVVVWLVARRLTGTASAASLLIIVGLPILAAAFGAAAWETATIVGMCVVLLVRHVDNIKRLLGRRELSADRAGG